LALVKFRLDEFTEYNFFKLKKSLSSRTSSKFQSGYIFAENFVLYETQEDISRTAYDIWAVLGDVGGLVEALVTILAFFMVPFAKK